MIDSLVNVDMIEPPPFIYLFIYFFFEGGLDPCETS